MTRGQEWTQATTRIDALKTLAHCQMTIDHAYKDWGIRLPTTGHQLPLMGPTGCTALPHLRPWCTLHQCQIQETGSTKDRSWDAKYFRLRNKLIRLEQQLAAM